MLKKRSTYFIFFSIQIYIIIRTMSKNKENKFSRVVLIIFLILFSLILVKAGFVIFSNKEKPISYKDPEVAKTVIRGNIIDTNDNLLAVEIPVYNLVFLKKEIDSLTLASQTVAPYLDMTPQEIMKKCESSNNYTLIKRKLNTEDLEKLRKDIKDSNLTNGVIIEKVTGRTYPASFHASQIIGFTNTENVGIEGIEYKYNDLLSPYPSLNESTTFGATVQLTLDLDIQYLMDVQVQNIIKNEDPDYIMAIITNAKTGEILASSSSPWYDLNNYSVSTEEQRFNRITGYNYEPGSVFKVFTLASVMEKGIDTSTPFYCDGEETFTVDGQKFVISCHEAHKEVTAKEMISKSCNGAIASWVLQLDKTYFYDFLKSLGFGTYIDAGLTAQGKGVLNPINSWSNRSQATLAFGQEIAVNALQVVAAASAIANDGMWVKPQILKSIYDKNGNTLELPTIETKRVMSAETAQKIRSYMLEATQTGTAILANVPGVDIASKTGTSEIINTETNSYVGGSTLASTLALVPAQDPKFIIYFAVANPKNNVWGANVASPAIASIVNGLIGQGKIQSNIQKSVEL